MLASIHPLGERARGQRFAVTATTYTLGSVLGAAAFGALLGGLGRFTLGTVDARIRLGVFAVAAIAAAVVDRRDAPVPSWHRQVNEDWLADVRGWVYGSGFGVQLGLGVVTIVTTASVYLAWVGAVLTAGVGTGAAVGATFGLARALPVAAAASATSPERVAARVRMLDAWDGRFRAVTLTAEALAATALIIATVA